MIRRFGEARVDGQRYTRRHGAYAIVLSGDSVLLTHQAWPDDEWQLPGGGIDAGESALQALRREVLEETGWRVRPVRRLGAFRRFCYMPDYALWAEKTVHDLHSTARAARRAAVRAGPFRALVPGGQGRDLAWQ